MIQKAREFAVKAHGGQMYGSAPYAVHLDAVAEILSGYGELAVYAAEYAAFKAAAYRAGVGEAIWAELDELLA